MEYQRKKFVYKIATFLKATGDKTVTLEKLLHQALKKFPKALDRAENPDGTEFRFLNYSGNHLIAESAQSIFGCEFLAFEQGADQSTIKIDPSATSVDVDAMLANKGEEFLAGAIYFGVAGNHVVLVQSKALRSKDLEAYINWILVEKTKVLSADNRIGLADHTPSKKTVKGVRGIEISSPIHLEAMSLPIAKGDREKQEEKHAFVPLKFGGKAWDVVKTMFGDGFDLPDGLKVADLANAPDIEVKVFLKWKASRNEDDVDFMNSIAKNLSHVSDEFDYTIHTRTGTITKDEFKIEQPFSYGWSKGRPKFEDIFPKMAAWLAELVELGKITV